MKWLHLILTMMATMGLISSCGGSDKLPKTEQSAFGSYVDSLDATHMQQCIQQLLKDDTTQWKADKAVRKRYKEIPDVGSHALWFTAMGLSADADSLLATLRRELPLAGLDTTAFFVPQIASDLSIVHQLAFDSLHIDINDILPRLDYYLSKAYVRYCAGQRYGFMRPAQVFNKLEYKPHTEDKVFAQLFAYDVESPEYSESVDMLSSDKRLDYLLTSLPQDTVSKALRQQMAKTNDSKERQKLAVNMERCRWRMKRSSLTTDKHIIVNIPAQQLWAVSLDSILNMRICCGAVTNKTPLLSSEISHMQVNPDWIVPQNIVKSDFLRHAGDSVYFARNNYYIVEKSSGDTLRVADVTAGELENGHLRVGQLGGVGNSLGRIVFRFDNDFGIYLHDTNNRKAFDRERRTLSHGCIRVQKPFEMACFLLPDADEWLLDRLRISMDIPPESDKGKKYLKEHKDDEQRPFRLLTYQRVTPRIPLYIIYYTAYPNPETGEVDFWPDLYGYDKVISKEIKPFIEK
jgi:hypothetical protein